MRFECSAGCGACCMNVSHLDGAGDDEYHIIDRGDGVCAHLDMDTLQCKIYDNRPFICRVEEGCPPGWDLMDWYKMNYDACATLRESERVKEIQAKAKDQRRDRGTGEDSGRGDGERPDRT